MAYANIRGGKIILGRCGPDLEAAVDACLDLEEVTQQINITYANRRTESEITFQLQGTPLKFQRTLATLLASRHEIDRNEEGIVFFILGAKFESLRIGATQVRHDDAVNLIVSLKQSSEKDPTGQTYYGSFEEIAKHAADQMLDGPLAALRETCMTPRQLRKAEHFVLSDRLYEPEEVADYVKKLTLRPELPNPAGKDNNFQPTLSGSVPVREGVPEFQTVYWPVRDTMVLSPQVFVEAVDLLLDNPANPMMKLAVLLNRHYGVAENFLMQPGRGLLSWMQPLMSYLRELKMVIEVVSEDNGVLIIVLTDA